jgi:Fe2+ or Zn2+ uptake regulation protein
MTPAEIVLAPLQPSVAEMLTPSVGKVMEFLIENMAFDYSKEEIAEGAEISRPTLYRIWTFLEKNGLIKATRKYQNTQLYKIDENNEQVKTVIKLEVAMVREQLKRMATAS